MSYQNRILNPITYRKFFINAARLFSNETWKFLQVRLSFQLCEPRRRNPQKTMVPTSTLALQGTDPNVSVKMSDSKG